MTSASVELPTAQGQEKATQLLQPGTKAPDFSLHVTPDQRLSLTDLAGKPVVLAFYPADSSPVCGDQMSLYNEALPEFEKTDMAPRSLASLSIVSGVTMPLQSITISTFRSSPTLSPRGRWRSNIGPTASTMDFASGRSS